MFTELNDFGPVWPIWLAGAGLVVLGCTLLLLLLIKRADVEAFFRRTLMRAPTLRGRLLVGFCVAGMIPLLTLPPLLVLNAASALQKQQAMQVEGMVRSMAGDLLAPIDRQVGDIATLAGHIDNVGDTSKAALVRWLLRHHERHPEYVSMWIARPDGEVVAATAFAGEPGQSGVKSWSGPIAGVALMDYFRAAVAQEGVYLSSVRKGVAAGYHPTMFISAPLGDPGTRPWGHLQVQLDLGKLIGARFDAGVLPGTHAVLLDARGRVVLRSDGAIFASFQDLAGHPLLPEVSRPAGSGQAGDAGDERAYIFSGSVDQSGAVGAYMAAARSLGNGWRMIAIVPMSALTGVLLTPLLLSLVWAAIAFLLARGLAGLYNGIVSDPLRELDESLYLFDSEPTISVIPTAPDQAPAEIQAVYNRVRESLRKSRNSYHTMLKALNDGEALRQELREGGRGIDPTTKAFTVLEESGEPTGATTVNTTYTGRLDPVTELPGRELFDEFFAEAWSLGVVGGRSLSLIVIGVDTADDVQLKFAALAFGDAAGRVLDLVARIDANQFAMVLPDTDQADALAVAERTLKSLQGVLANRSGDKVPCLNLAVVTIVPNPDGNSDSFVKLAQRVLLAARNKGDGQIAFTDHQGKIKIKESSDIDMIEWDADEAG
ncbi:MAG: diguanylate cyclase [Gammaproteobacteria bacterium]|nr:MAG: diguanylate cyclase [Gammaproteobacteria bacterium]